MKEEGTKGGRDRSTDKAFAELMGSDAPTHYALVPRKDRKGKKVEGRYSEVACPPDIETYQDHLDGRLGLSVVLNCRDDDGVLRMTKRILADSDDYSLAPDEVCRRLREQQIPASVTRSKSGGAHVHVFFKEKVPTDRARSLGFQIVAALALTDFEVFPKQEVIQQGQRRQPPVLRR